MLSGSLGGSGHKREVSDSLCSPPMLRAAVSAEASEGAWLDSASWSCRAGAEVSVPSVCLLVKLVSSVHPVEPQSPGGFVHLHVGLHLLTASAWITFPGPPHSGTKAHGNLDQNVSREKEDGSQRS